MSSILTNSSAMVALQTLKSINANLASTQNEISTGKNIASARDNSAIWAIAQVMQSDVAGFGAISESLSLGSSSVAVARNGAEQITDLLSQVKEKVVSAQEANVDRAKIQTDIGALRDQISSIVGSAQFNGLNFLNDGKAIVSVLASLDRASDGTVSASTIRVTKTDLGTQAQSFDAAGTYAAGSGTAGAASATLNATQTQTLVIAGVAAGTAYSIGMTGTDADSSAFVPASYTTAASTSGASAITYVARSGDTEVDVAKGLKAAWDTYSTANSLDNNVLNFAVVGNDLVATSGATDGTDTIAVRVDTVAGSHTAGGGLSALSGMDVTTNAGAAQALTDVEALIQTAIDAAAAMGSAQGRIEIQADFIGKLSDSLKTGIGALVDADMEETSARLQALQVQQQLGIQSLSIANQAPQNILALFR